MKSFRSVIYSKWKYETIMPIALNFWYNVVQTLLNEDIKH